MTIRPNSNRLVTSFLIEQTKAWLQEADIRVDGAERLVEGPNNTLVDLSTLQARFELDMAAVRGRGITDSMIKQALVVTLYQLEREHRSSVAQKIAYDSHKLEQGTHELQKWLEAVTGSSDELAIPLIVMRHFIWQVKRKLIGQPVKYHLMPVFHGPQGTGKSTAITLLLTPLEQYLLSGKSVPELCDSRNFRALGQNFVCFLDEMGRAERADVDSLKNVISNSTLSYRPLYSNRNTTTLQNVTFIGASNKDLCSLIKDSTGMRRFYQITCSSAAKASKAWSALNAVDVLSIWQSVDEEASTPEVERWLADIAEHQEGLRVTDSVEEFLMEFDVAAGSVAAVSLKQLYDTYKAFCRDANCATFGRQAFRRMLEMDYGIEFKRTNKGLCTTLNRTITNGSLLMVKELKG